MIDYRRILMHFLRDYLRDTGAEGYFPSMTDEELLETISDEVVERFQQMLVGAVT